ncbi:VWA domain-containing protein [Glaciihabitans arcticus]|uniref:VWA domain-containing protein n=1 Tax=Glaciihabitans arcticus TaxID=2668039 RepID=A0A4Q9GVY7_9MICO|nr:VWA domain-containing protein [Glaciihabitans arcticus]TBN56360.1 VWA domain-containing protein [Glaciihabitans arcticus]
MILQPVLPGVLLVLFAVILIGFALWQLIVARGRSAKLSWGLRIVLVLLLVVIAARPVIPATQSGPSASGGLEVYFVVDTTSSVSAEDWDGGQPRLVGVKSDIAAIAETLAGAQFSLVTFDAAAVQRVPLTTDATAIAGAASVITPEVSYYSRGSTIDEAVPLLEQLLGEASEENPGQQRVLFYLGDGEQTTATQPGSFETLLPFLSGGAVLGYGTEQGAPMLEFDGYADDDSEVAYLQDYSVTPPVEAISRIDEAALGTIASQLGLSYLHRTAGASVDEALAGIDVGELTVADGEPGSPVELYWIFAIPFGLIALFEAARIASAVIELRSPRRKRATS